MLLVHKLDPDGAVFDSLQSTQIWHIQIEARLDRTQNGQQTNLRPCRSSCPSAYPASSAETASRLQKVFRWDLFCIVWSSFQPVSLCWFFCSKVCLLRAESKEKSLAVPNLWKTGEHNNDEDTNAYSGKIFVEVQAEWICDGWVKLPFGTTFQPYL